MVKIPSKGSARYLSRKYDKSEDYIRYGREPSAGPNTLMSSDVVLSASAINNDLQAAITDRPTPIKINKTQLYFVQYYKTARHAVVCRCMSIFLFI